MRARQNGLLALEAGLGFDPEFNPDLPGSQPLTVISQTVAGGLLFFPSVRGVIERGEVGQLAALYHFNGLAGNVRLAPNPITAVSDILTNNAGSTYHALQVRARRRRQFSLDVPMPMSSISRGTSSPRVGACWGPSFCSRRRTEIQG